VIFPGDTSITDAYVTRGVAVELGGSSRQLPTKKSCEEMNTGRIKHRFPLSPQEVAAHFCTGAFGSCMIHFKLAAHFKHAVCMPHLGNITNLSSLTRQFVHILPYHREGWKATVIDGMIELFPCTVTRGAITSN